MMMMRREKHRVIDIIEMHRHHASENAHGRALMMITPRSRRPLLYEVATRCLRAAAEPAVATHEPPRRRRRSTRMRFRLQTFRRLRNDNVVAMKMRRAYLPARRYRRAGQASRRVVVSPRFLHP